MTANELDPRSVGGTTGQGGSISSAAPSDSPGGAADLDLDAIEAIRHNLAAAEHDLAGIPYTPPEAVIRWAKPLAAMARTLLDAHDNTTETTDQSRPVARVPDLDAIEARWLQICGHCDVDVLIAEVRALRAEVAALNAETRARCERIRAVLDRK